MRNSKYLCLHCLKWVYKLREILAQKVWRYEECHPWWCM